MKKIKGPFWSTPTRPVPSNKTLATFQKGLSFKHVLKVQYTFPNPKLGTPCLAVRLALDPEGRL